MPSGRCRAAGWAGAVRPPALRSTWVDSGANIDETGRYRYNLWRTWDPSRRTVAFCMLNPSTADETLEDPTIRRCIGFARSWGFGGVSIVNLFALRSTDPRALYDEPDPVGPYNDSSIAAASGVHALVVAAWGVHGALRGRGEEVRRRVLLGPVHHLGLTKNGHPRHPLYLRGDLEPAVWA